jgi:hypothetical protein
MVRSEIQSPGATTLPMNSVVIAPATTVTLGCVRGGKGSIRMTRNLSGGALATAQHQSCHVGI